MKILNEKAPVFKESNMKILNEKAYLFKESTMKILNVKACLQKKNSIISLTSTRKLGTLRKSTA